MSIKNKILKEVESLIKESTKVNFQGHSFILRVGVNEDPNKKGIKVQFVPTSFGTISQTEQNDLAIKVERDRNLKDKTIIGFFIYIEYIDKIIRQALKSAEDTSES